MTDFPPIYQKGNSEALAKLVADYAKESGIRMDTDVPAAVAEVPLQTRRKRTATDACSEASGAQSKKSRKDTSDASTVDICSAPMLKKNRRRKNTSNYTGSFHKPEVLLSSLHFQGEFH